MCKSREGVIGTVPDVPVSNPIEVKNIDDYSPSAIDETREIKKLFSNYNEEELNKFLQSCKDQGLNEIGAKVSLFGSEAENLVKKTNEIYGKMATTGDPKKIDLFEKQGLEPLYKQANDVVKYLNNKIKNGNLPEEEKNAYFSIIDGVCRSMAVAPNGNIINRELYNNYVESLKLKYPNWKEKLQFTENDAECLKSASNFDVINVSEHIRNIKKAGSFDEMADDGKAYWNKVRRKSNSFVHL